VEKDRSLERRFQAVKVPAPSEDESHSGDRRSARALREVPCRELHRTSSALCRLTCRTGTFPTAFADKAIDLIDEAGARVKLRQASVPEEVGEVQKRVKFITPTRMESRLRRTNSRRRAFIPKKSAKRRKPARLAGALQTG